MLLLGKCILILWMASALKTQPWTLSCENCHKEPSQKGPIRNRLTDLIVVCSHLLNAVKLKQHVKTHRSHEVWILHHASHHILHVWTLHHVLEHIWIAGHLLHQVLHGRCLKHAAHRTSTVTTENKSNFTDRSGKYC